MTREYARVRVDIWVNDDQFRELSPAAQHLYFVLLTSPHLSYCGVADWRPGRIAALASGWTAEQVREAAAELTEALYIVPDEETEEVLIRSFVRHDGVMKEARIAVSMVKAFGAVASNRIRGVIVHELKRLHEEDTAIEDETKRMKGWQTVKGEPGQALALLSLNAIDPVELVSDLLHELDQRLGDGLAQTLPNAWGSVSRSATPAPAPAPAPSTSDEVDDKDSCSAQPNEIEVEDGNDDDPDPFDDFWAAYPRKVAKPKARQAWARAIKRADVTVIMDGLARFHFKDDPTYIPHPASWLNADRWADEQSGLRLAASDGECTLSLAEVRDILGPPPQVPEAPSHLSDADQARWQKQWVIDKQAERQRLAREKLARRATSA